MIRLPEARSTDFKSVEQALNDCRSADDLAVVYRGIIDNYSRLNARYLFSERFDQDYVLSQLARYESIRDRELFGIPFGVKDVFNTKVLPTTMGSEIWKDFRPGNNARVVDEIADRGGIVFSKTTTAEFAVHYIQAGKTLNPHGDDRITGTSSAGSAVAVSCGALPICLGTQTAGSIIRPASFCGVFGFKPSFGAYDRTGVLKTADTLDTIGFLGSDIYGLRKTFVSTFQHDANYPNARRYFDSHRKYRSKDTVRIGIVTDQFCGYANYDPELRKDFDLLLDRLAGPGIRFDAIEDADFINEIHPLHAVIYNKSLSYYFQGEYEHGVGLSPLMAEMITVGSKISVDDFVDALSRQPTYQARFNALFEGYDFLITPSTGTPAPKVGGREIDDTCLIWSFLGYPVLTLPVFTSSDLNLPYGVQIVAPRCSDLSLLDCGQAMLSKLRSA